MKKIRVVNGKKVAFIEKSDIETLVTSKDFVRPEIFKEPAIINMECDTDGFYRIGNPNNAEYIENLGYIPDYDLLSKMPKETLEDLADKAVEDKAKISEIITKLCQYKEKLSRRDKATLKKADFVDQRCASLIEQNVLSASSERTIFRSMETALLAQARNYTLALIRMAEKKQELPNNGTKGKRIK